MTKMITLAEIQAALAYWVCRQSPYSSLDGVETVNRFLVHAARDWEAVPALPMRDFDDVSEVERWLWDAVKDMGIVRQWNRRVNGEEGMGIAWRYGRPHPDDDFIDLHALMRNVSMLVWREAEE